MAWWIWWCILGWNIRDFSFWFFLLFCFILFGVFWILIENLHTNTCSRPLKHVTKTFDGCPLYGARGQGNRLGGHRGHTRENEVSSFYYFGNPCSVTLNIIGDLKCARHSVKSWMQRWIRYEACPGRTCILAGETKAVIINSYILNKATHILLKARRKCYENPGEQDPA